MPKSRRKAVGFRISHFYWSFLNDIVAVKVLKAVVLTVTADPFLDGSSLRRQNNSVESRPWGILSLLPVASVTQAGGVFVKQVVFLTVNHRGPLPLRELHSTDETIVWRDPGGS